MIVNINTTSDADFKRTFIYKTITGLEIDIRGSSLNMKARQRLDDATVVVDIGTDDGNIVLTDPQFGQFTLQIPFASLSHMPAGTYFQSLIITWPSGLKEEVWHGTIAHTLGASR